MEFITIIADFLVNLVRLVEGGLDGLIDAGSSLLSSGADATDPEVAAGE